MQHASASRRDVARETRTVANAGASYGRGSAQRHQECCEPRAGQAMSDLIRIFSERGDLAHLALLLWASAASTALWFALRELSGAWRRFDDFVRELERFTRRAGRRNLSKQESDHGPTARNAGRAARRK